MILQPWKRWGLQEKHWTEVHSVCFQSLLISQIALIVQIITLEDAMRTYAQGKWKYGKSYLQKVREYSKTYIVTIQEKNLTRHIIIWHLWKFSPYFEHANWQMQTTKAILISMFCRLWTIIKFLPTVKRLAGKVAKALQQNLCFYFISLDFGHLKRAQGEDVEKLYT